MIDVKVRVVNKSKVGVTFKYLGVESFKSRDKATWEEFNDTFEKTDKKFIYRIKNKHLEVIIKKNEFFTKLMPYIMALRTQGGSDLTSLMHLGKAHEEYQEKFGGSPIDFITEYKQFEKIMFEQMMNEGIGIGNVHRKAHGWEEKPEYNYQEKADEGCSAGDMLRAKNE